MQISEQSSRFRYEISAYVQFTARDLRILKRSSDLHYDHKCKNIFTPGPGAFGNAMGAYFKDGESHVDPLDPEVSDDLVSQPYQAKWGDLDTMLKVLECASYDESIAGEALSLSLRIRQVLHAITDEQNRVGDQIPADNVPVERTELRCGMAYQSNVVVLHSTSETIDGDDYDVLHVEEIKPEYEDEREFTYKRKRGTRGWFWWRSREGEPLWNCGRCVGLEVAD
jgi:hypothetical protein